jgi:hypothetical protein
MEAYRDRDMEGWSETAREEIADFDFAMEGDVQRDSRKLRQFTISLTTDHIDPQGEWIKSRRSQAEEIGLCTLTHVNVLRRPKRRSVSSLAPRTVRMAVPTTPLLRSCVVTIF